MAGMRVLVASDGSRSSRAALELVLAFPWPAGTQARGAVSLGRAGVARTQFRPAMIRALHAGAEDLDHALERRWPDARVFELHDSPAEAILGEVRRFRADTVVLGWRGHGSFARLLAGSVSRAVAERAQCSVMVVRAATHPPAGGPRRFAIGFDGSENSRKAIRFLARLAPPSGNHVTLVNVLHPPASAALTRQAERRLRTAAVILERRGWQVSVRAASGEPLFSLLGEARRSRAEVLVVGARGASGLRGMLLGGVASGVLNQSMIPVLIAR